jgi:hypothetical protein
MGAILDTRRVRCTITSQLHSYYKDFLGQASEELGTQQLLRAIERGSIAPTTFAPWLSITKSPFVIVQGSRQNFSVIVRQASTMYLGKTLRSSQWKRIWDGLGGTAGLLELFSDMSVHDVRIACKLLAKCARGKDALEKRRCVTELFMGLQPHLFSDAPFKTTDRRPLAKFYRYLIPACTEELVERILLGDLKGKWKGPRDELLMQSHPEVMRREQLTALQCKPGASINPKRLEGLVNQYPTGHSTSGFSPSMAFSLQVLRVLVDNEDLVLDDNTFIDDLVRPLLRRALKKQVDWLKTQEIVDLTLRYLDKHPHTGSEITNSPGDVRHFVALCWAYQPELFNKQLRKLCSDSRFGTSRYSQPGDWTSFLSSIPKKRRYALLQLCLQESTGLDINNDGDLKKAQWNLSYELLVQLSAAEAFDLFTRFRAARGDNNVMQTSQNNTVLEISPAFKKIGSDNDMFHVFLLHQNGCGGEARQLARQRIEARKKEAARGKEPEQRTFYAQSALYYAIASGHVELYQEVLEWTKHFLRDPLVFHNLYSEHYPREACTLLAGVSIVSKPYTKADIGSRVKSGNAVLRSLFDTACAAIREPSFQEADWATTLQLFKKVLQQRIDSSLKLKEELKASSDELYAILWEDTLEMLLAVEEKAHRSENQRLEATGPGGPMERGRTIRVKLTAIEPSTYRFLDNLAKARDSFWKKLRSSVHPAVLALPKPFPRGLPLQHLISPWIISEPGLESLAPYISSRAKAVLFPDPAEALVPVPDDEEMKVAFGNFADSYEHALHLYVPKSCDKRERTKRASQVWSYAVDSLSSSRMSEEEMARYLQDKRPHYLKKVWPPSPQLEAAGSNWPEIPNVDDPAQRHEWNPATAGRPDSPLRPLGKLTYLDCTIIMNEENVFRTIDPWPKWSFSWTPEVPGHHIDLRQIWNRSRNMGEGGVLSALLYVEMMYGSAHGGLLEKPFPSADDARYPSLYLDGDFQGEPLNCYSAVRSIRGHLDSVPPALLHLSARNMIAELAASDHDEHSDGSAQELALNLLLRLSESDQPVLAQGMAIDTILNRPSASSWHRQLLKPSYLRRMSASDAKACFKTFSEAILERMLTSKNHHNESKVYKSMQSIEAAPSKPFVKVTTSKFLAQLLNGTEFIDEDSVFATLSTLLEMDTHIDVRLKITQSLLAMLGTSSPELEEKVFLALESLVPVAGNIHELKPVSESDWTTAEEDLALPEFPDVDEQSPTTKLFFDYFRTEPKESENRQTFLNRILLPTIRHRQTQITRWNALFLKKYSVDTTNLHVPVMPHYATQLLKKDFAPYLPASLLEDVVSHVIFTMSPPAPIVALQETLKSDTATMLRPDIFAWGSMYGGGINTATLFRRFDILLLLLDTRTKPPEHIGITPHIIQRLFLKVFKAIISADTPLYANLDKCLLHNLLNGTYLTHPWWPTHGKPLLTEMIRYVEDLCTPAWQADPNRVPSVLPDTFPWRLLLLDYPWPGKSDTEDETKRKCEVFAEQLSEIVNGDLSTRIYHRNLEQVKDYLALDPLSSSGTNARVYKVIGKKSVRVDKRDYVHEQLQVNRLRTAVQLGSVDTQDLEPRDVLRIELAAHLLGLIKNEWTAVNKEVKERVKDMVVQWKSVGDEGVRRVGWGVERFYK